MRPHGTENLILRGTSAAEAARGTRKRNVQRRPARGLLRGIHPRPVAVFFLEILTMELASYITLAIVALFVVALAVRMEWAERRQRS